MSTGSTEKNFGEKKSILPDTAKSNEIDKIKRLRPNKYLNLLKEMGVNFVTNPKPGVLTRSTEKNTNEIEKLNSLRNRDRKASNMLKEMGINFSAGPKPSPLTKSIEKGSGLKRNSYLRETDISSKLPKFVPRHSDFIKDIKYGVKNFSAERPKRNHLTVLSSQDADSPKRPSKMRKLEPSIRKELFKSNPKIAQFNKRASNLNNSINSSLAKPLECIDELEPLEDSNGFEESKPFKFNETKVKKTNLRFTKMQSPKIKKTPIRSNKKNTQNKTPCTSTDLEFLELEKEIVNTSSPVSSMCDLLKCTGLNSPTSMNLENTDNKLEESIRMIEHIMDIDNIEFNKYKKLHEENRQKIQKILNELKESTNKGSIKIKNENKENNPRRSSPRILMKSPILSMATNKSKIVVSPLLPTKPNDLRKTMLTRNLSKSLHQMENSASKEQQAQELYNSCKNVCAILCTPKINTKGILDLMGSENKRSYSLSKRVHNQCLMLQETPQHN